MSQFSFLIRRSVTSQYHELLTVSIPCIIFMCTYVCVFIGMRMATKMTNKLKVLYYLFPSDTIARNRYRAKYFHRKFVSYSFALRLSLSFSPPAVHTFPFCFCLIVISTITQWIVCGLGNFPFVFFVPRMVRARWSSLLARVPYSLSIAFARAHTHNKESDEI